MSFFDYIPGFSSFTNKLHHKRHFKKRSPYWTRKRRYLFAYKKKNWKRRSLPILRKWKQRWRERRRRRMKLRPRLRRRFRIKKRIRRSRIRYRRKQFIYKELEKHACNFGGDSKNVTKGLPSIFKGQGALHLNENSAAIRVNRNRRTVKSLSPSAVSYRRPITTPVSGNIVDRVETWIFETRRFFRTKLKGRKDKRKKGKREENQKLSFSEKVFYRILQAIFNLSYPFLLWIFVLLYDFFTKKVFKPARKRFFPLYTRYSQAISAFFLSLRISVVVYLTPWLAQVGEVVRPVVDFFDAQNFLVTLVEDFSFLFFSGILVPGAGIFFWISFVFSLFMLGYAFVVYTYFKYEGGNKVKLAKDKADLIIMLSEQREPILEMRSKLIARKRVKRLPKGEESSVKSGESK